MDQPQKEGQESVSKDTEAQPSTSAQSSSHVTSETTRQHSATISGRNPPKRKRCVSLGDISNVSENQRSPRRKRSRSSFSITEKQMVTHAYKYLYEEKEKAEPFQKPSKVDCANKTANILGINKSSVFKILKEKKENIAFQPPQKSGPKLSFKDKLDEFTFSAIRRKVHQFFYNNEAPTIEKVTKVVNEDPDLPNMGKTTMGKVLKYLNFKYLSRTRRNMLIDRQEIIAWHRKYLLQIKKIRTEGRQIYYQDETWVNAGHTTKKAWSDLSVTSSRQAFLDGLTTGLKSPSGKGQRLIISHIGSNEGFVEGAALIFRSKSGHQDYHQEMNSVCFEEWLRGVLPKLRPNSVLVIDNAPYHSRKTDPFPNMSWLKQRIIDWLTEKNIPFAESDTKSDLITRAKNAGEHTDTYAVDELAKEYGIEVLRLPPYHCELNPIELVWAQVKGHVARHNKTYKINDVEQLFQEGLLDVTPEKWNKCVSHVIKEEDKMMTLDHIIDTVSDRIIICPGEDSSSSSSDSEISDCSDDEELDISF